MPHRMPQPLRRCSACAALLFAALLSLPVRADVSQPGDVAEGRRSTTAAAWRFDGRDSLGDWRRRAPGPRSPVHPSFDAKNKAAEFVSPADTLTVAHEKAPRFRHGDSVTFDFWLAPGPMPEKCFNGSGVYRNAAGGKPERYSINGADRKLDDGEYMPDICHERVVKFVRQHRDEPFFVYYSLSHVHGELMPTPDSAPGSIDLMADNIAYMDKLVGRLIAELDTLKLREKTLVIFMGDNGTGKGQADRATIGGKMLSGMKGTMLECGGLVPMIACWPGKTPAGRVCEDLVDSTDFVATFAALTGSNLPSGMVFDGRSIAPHLLGRPARPREWIFNQLARMWYVRDAQWKLNEKGELYDMSGAPFSEKLVTGPQKARVRLKAVLAKLNPAGGILDQGDDSGRHANKKPPSKEK